MRFQIIAVVLAAATSSVLGAPVSTTEPVPVAATGSTPVGGAAANAFCAWCKWDW
ncbi:hypothetical protein SIIN_6634_T [Serendipita indica DSM 11827]|nr:hypothetical protein SIIN_6634_T [Serendipita indica DSM 11827]